jgi:hypothetical protein
VLFSGKAHASFDNAMLELLCMYASPQLAAYKKAASLAFAGCVSFEQLMDSMTRRTHTHTQKN